MKALLTQNSKKRILESHVLSPSLKHNAMIGTHAQKSTKLEELKEKYSTFLEKLNA
jgi:hypothetical protein